MKDPITLLLRIFGKEINPKNSPIFAHMMDTTHGNWHYRLFNNGQIENYKYENFTIDNS
jgi:hypothetical protein